MRTHRRVGTPAAYTDFVNYAIIPSEEKGQIMSEEKTKVLIPFRQPISIMNQTQPGEEEGEVVPVPIHIIVDNAADFPVCDCGGGGGGGGVKLALLSFPPETINVLKSHVSHASSDPYGMFSIVVAPTDDLQSIMNDREFYTSLILSSEDSATYENLTTSVPTGYDLCVLVYCFSGGVSPNSLIASLIDADSYEQIQEVSIESKQFYEDTMLYFGPFSIPEDFENTAFLSVYENENSLI